MELLEKLHQRFKRELNPYTLKMYEEGRRILPPKLAHMFATIFNVPVDYFYRPDEETI